MNILLLHYSAPPVVGGVENILGQHARLMAEAGHQVRVVAGRGAQVEARVPFISLPLADSTHADVLEVKARLDKGVVPPKFAQLVAALSAALVQLSAGSDVVIAHNVYSLHKNLALTAALKNLMDRPAPPYLILWHHDLAWTTPRYRSELHPGYPWDLLRNPPPAALHVTVSEARRGELAGLLGIPPEQIAVIPNGVNPGRFFKLEARTMEFVRRMDLLARAPLLLLPVRITARKNLEFALQVMASLRERCPRAALVVTGPLGAHNPNNVGYFNDLLAEREELGLVAAVYFLAEFSRDYLPEAVISDFYRLADALFLPSREEGFGIPILEAGLSGLPIFCTDIPALRDLAGGQAVYFPLDAIPDQVAALIADTLSSDVRFQLRTRVREQYNWERIFSERINPLLESLRGRT